MFVLRRGKQISLVMVVLLLVMVGCAPFAPTGQKRSSHGTQSGECTVAGCSSAVRSRLLTPTPAPTLPAGPSIRPFIDTWNNVHLDQVFAYNIADPTPVAPYYDFVWGVTPDKVAAFRTGNPNISLSYYFSFFRDSGTYGHQDSYQSLAYWRGLHPDWILYQCDRATPVSEDGLGNTSFDFTNPAVVAWQVQTYAQPASQQGYDAIAADNVNLDNVVQACGHYDKNGQWVQLFSGARNDPLWRQGVLRWATQMQSALHALAHPLALVPNLSLDGVSTDANDQVVQQIVAHIDGVLDEGGFTSYGDAVVTDNNWLQIVHFIESVQQQKKAYFLVNLYHNSVGSSDILWTLASYLMCKEHAASLFVGNSQNYGYDSRYQEYNVQIGNPKGEMYFAQGMYWRNYTHGLVLVNPSATATYTVTLSGLYKDIYGHTISQSITLPPHSGEVLLSA